jgi:hypothetical protein
MFAWPDLPLYYILKTTLKIFTGREWNFKYFSEVRLLLILLTVQEKLIILLLKSYFSDCKVFLAKEFNELNFIDIAYIMSHTR